MSRVRSSLRWLMVAATAWSCDGWEPPPHAEISSTSSGAPLTQTERDCSAMCDRAYQLGCEDLSCTERCVHSISIAGPCEPTTSAYVACLAREGLDSCTVVPPACTQSYDAFVACAGDGRCGPVQCIDPGPAACKCQATCDGAVYSESCIANDDGSYQCICERDGEHIAECASAPLACAFFIGCCSAELPDGG